MAASEVSAAAEQGVEAIPPPKQTTAANLSVWQSSSSCPTWSRR